LHREPQIEGRLAFGEPDGVAKYRFEQREDIEGHERLQRSGAAELRQRNGSRTDVPSG
jgi:hypothetical protein